MHTSHSIPFKNASRSMITIKMTLLKLFLLIIIPILSLPNIINALPQSSASSSSSSNLTAFSSNNINDINNNNYIIVLKPNLSKTNITKHIHRVQKFHTSSPSTNLTSLASIPPIHTSTIGNFQFYSSQLNDESLLSNDEAIHYYVKDIPMSLQELVQSNPPSWVNIYIYIYISAPLIFQVTKNYYYPL